MTRRTRGGSGLLRNLTLWGSGDYRNFSGGSQDALAYDGDVTSANLGVDTKLGADVLAGVSVGRARGTADYSDSNAISGELTTNVTSINPYVGWRAPGGMNLWATVGYGSGEVEVDDSTGTQASDLTQQMAAAGVSGPLVASDELIAGGTTSLRVKGETAFTRAELDGSEALESMTLNANRHRLMLEGSHVRDLASGATLTPLIEIGVRNDGGDGETGTSVEAGGGLRYADQATGLTVETRARTLLTHSGDYEEWGVSGLVRLDPGTAGEGLSFSVRPAWGQTASGVQQLWRTG
ncbi:MAG: autotransporter domain-containing protein, partial [Rhodospirillales bacterium]|nr:autotransporter domain-containing protein [Rhodospirillales bacterium]